MIFRKNKKLKNIKKEDGEVKKIFNNEHISKINSLINRQRYQRIMSEKILKEAKEAIESTEILMDSVYQINLQLEKYNEHISKTTNVSSEVAAFSQEVSASVDESMNAIEETMDRAKIGKKSLEEIMDSFNEMKDVVVNISSAMNKFSEKTNEIKGIVDTIKNISKTTHLLSLNANIEAARAGEAGKSFGVVAKEVKKLAESSSESADNINDIIEEITAVTDETLSIVSAGVNKVEDSVDAVKGSGKTIVDMMVSIDKSKNLSYRISDYVREQADKNQNMLSVIDEMINVSEKVKVFNENISINVYKQKALLNVLENTINNLNEVAAVDENSSNTEKDVLKMMINNIKSLDPSMATDINSTQILSPIHKGLVQFGIGTEVVGAIARNWHVEEDNVTWNFNLRKDMKFHNGRNITAEDVKYTFERLLSKKLNSPNRWFLSFIDGADEYYEGRSHSVSGIIVTGTYTLKIVLKYPYSKFINNLAHICCVILPKEEIKNIETKCVGAGPFKVLSKDNNKLILEKVYKYVLGEAIIDSIEMNFSADDDVKAFINEDIDYININVSNIDDIKNSGYKIDRTECIGARFLAFNFKSNNTIVHNKEIRQAINYCIDREKIIREALGGFDIISKRVFPESLLINSDYRVYNTNLRKAKDIMRNHKIINGALTLQVSDSGLNKGFHQKVVNILSENLREIGIGIKIVKVPSKDYYSKENIKKCDIFIYGWIGDSGTADNFIEPLIAPNNAMNLGEYDNEEVVELLEKAKKIQNPYKYKKSMVELENKMIEDAPWVFLSNICTTYAYQKKIKGLKIHPLNIINYSDIWIENS